MPRSRSHDCCLISGDQCLDLLAERRERRNSPRLAGEPVRHRYNPGGNRRVNAVLHRMAVTQLRCEPRAQTIYNNARAHQHTKKEARRVLIRHLSDVVYRRMIRDQASSLAQPLLAA